MRIKLLLGREDHRFPHGSEGFECKHTKEESLPDFEELEVCECAAGAEVGLKGRESLFAGRTI